ncbi:AAA family ATPase [Paenibacillus sp. Marseille-Q4541]|uniref:AAA family ATPase n=1 Tax=Paenibacillus sp. Marseille-Q4541 TaxID=2831522 RepID=UPI001BA76B78|nr:AAA family ATPase [Paenibacillus sp. Marseille-Q4541]
MRQQIIVITGIMAAGKSTVSDLLAARLKKAVHLRGDIFRKMIVSGRVEMSSQPSEEALSQLGLRYLLTAQAAKAYYDAGFTVVIQDNYLGEKLSEFLQMLEPYPMSVIVLCPDVEAVRKRENNRNKVGYVGFTVEELHAMFTVTTPHIGLWLDTSSISAEQSVDRIMDYLQSSIR